MYFEKYVPPRLALYGIELRTGNIGSLTDKCAAESLFTCCSEHILRETDLLSYETAG